MDISKLIDPLELIGWVREVQDEYERTENETLGRWLPVRTTPRIKFEYDLDPTEERGMARFRAFDAETPIASIETSVETRTAQLIPIGLKHVMSEKDLLDAREMGTSDIVDLVYMNAAKLTRWILDRFEQQRGEAIVNDSITINENRLKLGTLTFGRDAANAGAAAVFWSDPTADMLDDILEWERYYLDITGKRVGAWLTSSDVRLEMVRNNGLREIVLGADLSQARSTVSFDEMTNQLRAFEVAPVIPYDKVLDDGSGTLSRVIAANKFIALPAQEVGAVMMGPTVEADEYQLGAQAPGLIASAHWGFDAVNRQVRVNGTGLTILSNTNEIMVFDVLA